MDATSGTVVIVTLQRRYGHARGSATFGTGNRDFTTCHRFAPTLRPGLYNLPVSACDSLLKNFKEFTQMPAGWGPKMPPFLARRPSPNIQHDTPATLMPSQS